MDRARFHFFDRMRLWFNHHEPEPSASDDSSENVISLSEAFYREIDQHRIPVEREVIAALAHAPGMLDFYMWMVWKSWTLNGRTAQVPLFGDGGLTSQLGSTEYSARRRFRQIITEWTVKVKALWPECPAEISPDGRYLVVRSPKFCPTIRTMRCSSLAVGTRSLTKVLHKHDMALQVVGFGVEDPLSIRRYR